MWTARRRCRHQGGGRADRCTARAVHPRPGALLSTSAISGPLTEKEWPGHGVFLPLGPAVSVLGFLHEPKLHRGVFRPLDFSERLTLNRGYTALPNLRLWEDAERFVVAHPSDRAMIETIDNGAEIRIDPDGPYRFQRFGFLGDLLTRPIPAEGAGTWFSQNVAALDAARALSSRLLDGGQVRVW
jgi:hypothetical protein